ncbi:MAG TPA: c-type cytochrome domain-containing protein [Opitutaceae bacterium]
MRRTARWGPVLLLLSGVVVSAAETAYDKVVQPIFEARCASCHGAEKKKGKLALHTWEAVMKGGDSGPLWQAGKPAESELVRRLKLPHDDEEHMPPSGETQLAAEEIALIVRWIERGAAHKGGIDDLKLEPALAKAAAELAEKLAAHGDTGGKAEPLWEYDPAAVERSRAPLAQKIATLQQAFPGALSYESRTATTVRFTAAGLGRDFGDAQLAKLADLGEALAELDLSGTAVTDGAGATLSRLVNLRVLRLGYTAVGDGTVAALEKLAKLEVLVLTGTEATPASLPVVGKLGALKRLHAGEGTLAEAALAARLPVVDNGAPPPMTAEAK